MVFGMTAQALNLLQQLGQMTTVVADTGDLSAVARLRPIDATTNPSLITAAAALPSSIPMLNAAHQRASQEGWQADALIERMIDLLTVQLGIEILKLIDGRVSTEVDARLSYDTDATIHKARELIGLYEAAGIDRARVLIKIASTWQGIKAAEQLEQEGIHCNLTLLFGLHQAVACGEAGITLISPFVGRILDWQKKAEGRTDIAIEQDAGVLSVKQIYAYYKQHGYKTEVMGASFRSTAQIIALAGCDLLTIAPALLDQLATMHGTLEQVLSAHMISDPMPRQTIDPATFEQQHQHNPMAFELLQGGIDGFINARQQLTEQLHQTFGVGTLAS